MNHVRPELGLHDDQRLRLHAAQEQRPGPGQVIGSVGMERGGAPDRLHARGARRRHGGDENRQAGMGGSPGIDQGSGRLRLAYRHGMHPEAAMHCRNAQAKTLAHALEVVRRTARAPEQPQQHERQQQVEQHCVEKTRHVSLPLFLRARTGSGPDGQVGIRAEALPLQDSPSKSACSASRSFNYKPTPWAGTGQQEACLYEAVPASAKFIC